MLDICLIGTGGTMPLVNRWLTSLMVRYKGHGLLIDCGEGTQIAAQRAGISLKPVETLLLTHLHADHVSGLPGMLLTMGNMGKTDPLHIIGPRGTADVVKALTIIAPGLTFPLEVTEITGETQELAFHDCLIRAFRVQHRVACYGYSLELKRSGKFDPQRAKEQGIPLCHWHALQKGESIEHDGQTYAPDSVLGPDRKGLKLTYCTDSRPTDRIIEAAANSDLFICEGMYGDDSFQQKAIDKSHMLFSEAATMAATAGGVAELWLTHYSPSLPNPKDFRDVARAIFPKTYTPRDGWKKSLQFDER